MKRVINGAVYNTESAIYIGIYNSRKELDDMRRFTEELYRTRSGKFFLLLSGARNPQYHTKRNEPKIVSLAFEEAQNWVKEKLSPEQFQTLFGLPEHPEKKQNMHISLSAKTVHLLNQKRAETGTSISELIEWAVEAQFDDIADNEKE